MAEKRNDPVLAELSNLHEAFALEFDAFRSEITALLAKLDLLLEEVRKGRLNMDRTKEGEQ